MADFYVPDEAELNWLNYGLTRIVSDSLRFHLYKNDYTPVQGTTFGDFVEADYSGYAGQTADPGTPATGTDHKAHVLFTQVQFPYASSSTQTVYGYYCVDGDDNLYGARRFATPITISTTVRVDAFKLDFSLYQP